MIARVVDETALAKRLLRTRIREQRTARAHDGSGAQVAAALLAAARDAGLLDPPDDAAPGPVAAYVAAAGEPDPAGIRALVRTAGGTVLLPIPLPGRSLAWARDDGQYIPSERFPVPRPAGPSLGSGIAPLVALGVRLVLAPALAVDRSGTRLGQGGGYYDTLLAELATIPEPPRVVVVVHDEEVLPPDTLPRARHDTPVHEALTPGGLVVLVG
jgi:5-formyltetrahydrofolate cyclo-ligase